MRGDSLNLLHERLEGVSAAIIVVTTSVLGTLLSSSRVTDLQYSMSASRIPKNFLICPL